MHTVHMKQKESMTIVVPAPKYRLRRAGPTVHHKDQRRINRGTQKVRLKKGEGW